MPFAAHVLPHPAGIGLYRSVWRYAAGARAALVGSVALLAGSQIVKLGVPWCAGQAIDALQHGGASALHRASGWVLLLLGVYAGNWALHGPGRILERGVGMQVRQRVSAALFDKLVQAPAAWHDRHHSGELQQRLSQASGALANFAQGQFVYIQSAVNFVGPVLALTLLSPRTGGLALLGYAAVGCAIMRFDVTLVRLARLENAAERKFAAGLLDFVGNMATIVGLRLQPSARRLLQTRLGAVLVPMRRSILVNEAKWCVVDLMGATLTWSLVLTYAWQARQSASPLLIGSVFMVYRYAQQAGEVLGNMASNFQGFVRARVDFSSADLIWQAPVRNAVADALPPDWQRIEVRDLCFQHVTGSDEADGRASALHHVSLTLRRGERIALVGPSGSGKSTLMRVLAGLYDAAHGHLMVDGVAHLGVRALAPISTLILQEAEVFETSVLENIAFDMQTDAVHLQTALRVSAFDAVLAGMPAGLATPIGERGSNLSGGQRQRLCLARGLLAARQSALVLLDEPTSALDPLTEAQVDSALRGTFPDACIVSSVHRLSLLAHVDTVVLMAEGRIVDSGTVDDLLQRQPMFAEMMRGQLGTPTPVATAA